MRGGRRDVNVKVELSLDTHSMAVITEVIARTHQLQLDKLERKIMSTLKEQEARLNTSLQAAKASMTSAADRVIAALQAKNEASNVDLTDEIAMIEEMKTAADQIAPASTTTEPTQPTADPSAV